MYYGMHNVGAAEPLRVIEYCQRLKYCLVTPNYTVGRPPDYAVICCGILEATHMCGRPTLPLSCIVLPWHVFYWSNLTGVRELFSR